ncbi:MAG TPA: hypothetical protein VL651_17565 [Bacteroidia bacterium]|jgi:hypothetical protein|nr:hypothetical protein [Bacteroidia bacterium]
MKSIYFLLFSIILSLNISAQKDPLHNYLDSDFVVQHRIKSVKVVTLFSAYKDSSKFDTGAVYIQDYDPRGRITSDDYRSVIDKSTYRSKENFDYHTSDKMYSRIEITDGLKYDSTFYFSETHYLRTDFSSGTIVIHELQNDSVMKETRISGTDTSTHLSKYKIKEQRDHFDWEYSGSYASRGIRHNTAQHIDTCFFYDEKGKLKMKIVDHYDSAGNVTLTEYFNAGDPDAKGFYARYNEKMNMTDWIPVKKKGAWSYSTYSSYYDNGLLKEKNMKSASWHFTPVYVRYFYEYY